MLWPAAVAAARGVVWQGIVARPDGDAIEPAIRSAPLPAVAEIKTPNPLFISPVETEKMNITDKPLSPDLLRKMNAYWRAANYSRSGRFIFTTIRC